MVAFFIEHCGARVESITPADAPHDVTVRIGDASICLRRAQLDQPVSLIVRDDSVEHVHVVTAPNGLTVEFRPETTTTEIPPSVPSLSVVRAGDEFGIGRAGMGYRDLLPDRWGGRFIASHILIRDGGPVPDYVHFHRIRFQLIFCARGWVDVVYEDQGDPFRLHAGDCVLQPPEIRHRVLRSSPGLEVIEIGCPAVHDTFVEHEITLPTGEIRPGRSFSGQRFVRHVAADAPRTPWLVDGLRVRDTGIGSATDGLGAAVVVEAGAPHREHPAVGTLTHHGEFAFSVVLRGAVDLSLDDGDALRLMERESVALPPGTRWRWSGWTDDFEMLQVTLPDAAVVRAP
jgi:quercetin dioxygenase-like cupin family protein